MLTHAEAVARIRHAIESRGLSKANEEHKIDDVLDAYDEIVDVIADAVSTLDLDITMDHVGKNGVLHS